MSLDIIDLLQEVGIEKVFVQNVLENMTNAQARKGGETAITFVTGSHIFSPNDAISDPRYVGLVVWMPAEDVKRVRAGLKGGAK